MLHAQISQLIFLFIVFNCVYHQHTLNILIVNMCILGTFCQHGHCVQTSYLLTYLLTAHYASWHIGQQQKLSTPSDPGPVFGCMVSHVWFRSFISPSTVLRQVFLGRPLFLLPSGVQWRAVRVMSSMFFLIDDITRTSHALHTRPNFKRMMIACLTII